MEQRRIYCVTGGKGYVGSWLVKTLLEKGCIVHATLRDLDNPGPLNSLEGAEGRLRVFKADLLEENSFDKAVEGCHGVFHVASPVEFFAKSEFYFLSKVLAEQEALKYGEEHKNEIEVVTIVPAIVAGPFTTSELPKTCALLSSFFVDCFTMWLHCEKC